MSAENGGGIFWYLEKAVDESVEVLEHVVAGYFSRLGGKDVGLCAVLGILGEVELLCEGGLEIDILVLQVLEVLHDLLALNDGLVVEGFLHLGLQVDQPPIAVLELIESPVDGVLRVVDFIPQLLGPLGQQSEDGGVVDLELPCLDLAVTEHLDAIGYFLADLHCLLGVPDVAALPLPIIH